MQRGLGFSPPARFSPGAIGALFFPAAFHAPQKSTIFEPAFGLMAMLKTSLCEAWKTIESTSTAPRDRWERSWLWKSGTWLAARLWAGPLYTNKLHLATKNSSQAWNPGAQLGGRSSCSSLWSQARACVTTLGAFLLPPVPHKELHRWGWFMPIVGGCAGLLHTKLPDSDEKNLVEQQNLSCLYYS